MIMSNETIAIRDDEAERFDRGTELVIRRHRQQAARRPASEMIPLGQHLTTMSPATSSDAIPMTPADLPMWKTTPTSPTTCVKPVCPHCDGAGYYKEAVPFGHPHFGVLFPCGCKLAEQLAQRARAVDQVLARLAGGLGFLAATRLVDITCDRPLDPLVEWCGVRADRAYSECPRSRTTSARSTRLCAQHPGRQSGAARHPAARRAGRRRYGL